MNIRTPFLNADWTQSVRPGDLVAFGFPYPSTEDCRTRQTRPCLVVDRAEYLGAVFLALIPATQDPGHKPGPHDLWIEAPALFPEHQHLGRWRILPAYMDRFDARHRGFIRSDGASPVIGRAYGSLLEAVEHLRSQHLELRERHVRERRRRRASRRLRP
jgi:hypothetical protein